MSYDLLVIGAGSGGVRAARVAATMGQKVAVIEVGALGGTCVNVGCVPKKLFSYAAHVSESVEESAGFGWTASELKFDWQVLLRNKNAEILRLNGIYNNILSNAGVEIIAGRAKVVGKNEVLVEGKTYKAERVLIATGSKPFVPDFPGNENLVTSDDMFFLDNLPKKALVMGGGYIAVEFAGILNGFGVETQLMYRGEKLLRGFDDDLRDALTQAMRDKGIEVILNDNIDNVEKTASGLKVSTKTGLTIETDLALSATGRVPNTKDLGLESAGVELNPNGSIKVDQNFQSNVSSIYALGDVIDRFQLTPVAIEEAMVLVDHLYGEQQKVMNYENIASAVFSQPNLATVGITEAQAREKYGEIQIYKSEFRAMKHVLGDSPEKVLMKIIVDVASDKVVGVHMMGADAGELIQGIAIAIKAGATKRNFDETIGIHPTSAEEMVTMREVFSN